MKYEDILYEHMIKAYEKAKDAKSESERQYWLRIVKLLQRDLDEYARSKPVFTIDDYINMLF